MSRGFGQKPPPMQSSVSWCWGCNNLSWPDHHCVLTETNATRVMIILWSGIVVIMWLLCRDYLEQIIIACRRRQVQWDLWLCDKEVSSLDCCVETILSRSPLHADGDKCNEIDNYVIRKRPYHVTVVPSEVRVDHTVSSSNRVSSVMLIRYNHSLLVCTYKKIEKTNDQCVLTETNVSMNRDNAYHVIRWFCE